MPLKRSTALVVAALCAVVLVAYAAPLVGGATFVGRDHLSHTLPSKQFLAESLRAGALPYWWDGIDLGVPFIANPNHSALYPPAWIVAVLPFPFGADALLILHVVFAGIGMALLSRRWGATSAGQVVAAIGFMLSGFVTSTVVHGGPLLTLAWIPWCACAADRLAVATERRERASGALWLAAATSAQLLAGDPSIVIVGGFVVLAIALCRGDRPLRSPATVVVSFVGSVAMASVVIIPALLLLGDTLRGEMDSVSAQTWSMHPLRLVEWIWPGALGDPNQPSTHAARIIANTAEGSVGLGPSWALSLYLGLPILVFAAAGWRNFVGRRYTLLACAVLFLLLAVGKFTPMYGVFRFLFPPEQLVRYPEKYALGALVIVCGLAGLGFTKLVAGPVSRRFIAATAAVIVLVGVVVGVIRVYGATFVDGPVNAPPIDPRGWLAHATDGAIAAAIAAAAITVGMLIAKRTQATRIGLGVAIVALAAHLAARTWSTLPLTARSQVTQRPSLLEGVNSPSGEGIRARINRPVNIDAPPDLTHVQSAIHAYNTARQNTSTRFGFADVPGYDQAHTKRLKRVRDATSRRLMVATYGVELAILPEHHAAAEGMTILARADASNAVLARTEAPRPRAFVTSRWQWFESEAAMLAALFPRRTGPPDTDVLATVHLLGTGTNGAGPARITPCRARSARPDRVSLECTADVASFVVLLDTWAPGWSATVDGKPARIELADGMVRAVHVEAGAHLIEFSYRAPGLFVGAIVTLVGWLAWFGALVFVRRRS